MTSGERQKLLYFATGSSVLPALDNRVGNNGKSVKVMRSFIHDIGWYNSNSQNQSQER